jgi:uncharacterized DUF497 family protein
VQTLNHITRFNLLLAGTSILYLIQACGVTSGVTKAVFNRDTVTLEDDRYGYKEQRFVTFGLLQGRVVAVVHTERSDFTRIISARKATKYEQRTYFEQLSD